MKTKFDGKHLFFTSDTHFNHKNIIKYCNRPFNSVEEMNESLINNWNKVVTDKDDIIILGDFYWQAKEKDWLNILNQLNGTKYLIVGNHDQNIPEKEFVWVKDLVYITVRNIDNSITKVCLCHYPLIDWGNRVHGCINLHGHLHTSPRATCVSIFGQPLDILLAKDQYDVGVDNNDFTPISWNQIITNKLISINENMFNK